MPKISAAVLGLPKTDNAPTATKSKIHLRQLVLDRIGRERAAVFDAFAGEGHMHKAVWHQAARYLGCDQRFFPDARTCFVADNLRVLRAIDLRPWNIFDLDAYGSPWEQLNIIAHRRGRLDPGETVGLVLTDGHNLTMKMGGMSQGLAELARVRQRAVGLHRMQDQINTRAVNRVAELLGGRVTGRWEARGKLASQMIYTAIVIEGTAAEALAA